VDRPHDLPRLGCAYNPDHEPEMHTYSTFPCWHDAVLNAYHFFARMFSKALIYLTTLVASSAVLSQNGGAVSAQYLLGLGQLAGWLYSYSTEGFLHRQALPTSLGMFLFINKESSTIAERTRF
jgi:hypothetical protein